MTTDAEFDASYPTIGSEVDRLRRIIREQDETTQRVLKERNDAWGRLAVAQEAMCKIAALGGDAREWQRSVVREMARVASDALTATGTREAEILRAAERLEAEHRSSTPCHRGICVCPICAAVRGEESHG